MKKNFIRIFCVISLVCILMLSTLSACSNNSDDRLVYEVASFNSFSSQISKINAAEPQKIVTYEQLTAFCSEAEMPINDKNSWNNVPDIYKKISSYNKKFFKSKSLIIVSIEKGHPQGLEIANLKIDDDALIINVLNEENPYDMSASYPSVMDYHLFLIEINKKPISNINRFVVKEYNNLNSIK